MENDLLLRIDIIKLLQVYSSKSRMSCNFLPIYVRSIYFNYALANCVARMLTHDCIRRLVSRMNDSDPSGE